MSDFQRDQWATEAMADISYSDALWNHVNKKRNDRERKGAREIVSVLTDLSRRMPPVIALTQQLQTRPSII